MAKFLLSGSLWRERGFKDKLQYLSRLGVSRSTAYRQQCFSTDGHRQTRSGLSQFSSQLCAEVFVFTHHPVPVLWKEQRTVSENHAGWALKGFSCETNKRFEQSHSMVLRSYREIDEHDGIAGLFMIAPGTVFRKFLECGRDFRRLAC